MEEYLRNLRVAADWANEHWQSLSSSTRVRIFAFLGQHVSPFFFIGAAQEGRLEIERILREYHRDPQKLLREFTDYLMPRTRYGQIANQLRPGSESLPGYNQEISRPVILVPGMVGTRLMRTGELPRTASSSSPDRLREWMETQFRTEHSIFLQGIPTSLRQALIPALTRISDRNLYNPRAVWDPDSPYAMIDIMNKTATERGALFCAEDTPAAPATEFATEIAESMTIEGLLSFLFNPRMVREIENAVGIDLLRQQDQRFEALRRHRRDRGWSQVVWDISKDWLLPLERSFGQVTYAFGYDWRQPLATAAEQLVQKIERVKRHHDGKSPILVTHSFGGLIARAAAKIRPQNVAGIVQVFSPTAGSIKMFTNFKKGGGGTIPPAWDREQPWWDLEQPNDQTRLENFFNFDILSTFVGFNGIDAAFGVILGWDPVAFAVASAGCYGAYSLLPNNVQRFHSQLPWLKIEDDPSLLRELVRSRNIYDLYKQFDQPWGLLDGQILNPLSRTPVNTGDASERAWQWLQNTAGAGRAGSFIRLLHSYQRSGLLRLFTRETLSVSQVSTINRRVLHGIECAKQLNISVGNYVHPNTWSIYGSGLDTDVGFNIRRTAPGVFATHRIVSHDGDGSLEVSSARALSNRFQKEVHLTDVKHADAMTTSRVAQGALVSTVYYAMIAAYRADQITAGGVVSP